MDGGILQATTPLPSSFKDYAMSELISRVGAAGSLVQCGFLTLW